jgi:hypothetical protein
MEQGMEPFDGARGRRTHSTIICTPLPAPAKDVAGETRAPPRWGRSIRSPYCFVEGRRQYANEPADICTYCTLLFATNHRIIL